MFLNIFKLANSKAATYKDIKINDLDHSNSLTWLIHKINANQSNVYSSFAPVFPERDSLGKTHGKT
jgi:hypothetical protein